MTGTPSAKDAVPALFPVQVCFVVSDVPTGPALFELLASRAGGDDPYAAHLARGEHGLVHAGGPAPAEPPDGASIECEWVEAREPFALHDWAGGERALQVRRPPG